MTQYEADLFLPNMVLWWVIGRLCTSCSSKYGRVVGDGVNHSFFFFEVPKSDQGGNQKQLIKFVWPDVSCWPD